MKLILLIALAIIFSSCGTEKKKIEVEIPKTEPRKVATPEIPKLPLGMTRCDLSVPLQQDFTSDLGEGSILITPVVSKDDSENLDWIKSKKISFIPLAVLSFDFQLEISDPQTHRNLADQYADIEISLMVDNVTTIEKPIFLAMKSKDNPSAVGTIIGTMITNIDIESQNMVITINKLGVKLGEIKLPLVVNAQ